MKTNKYIVLLMSLGVISCAKTWDEKSDNRWDPKYTWEVAEIAEGVLYNAYTAMPTRPDSYGSNFLDAATDNALTNSYDSSVYKLSMGLLSTTNNPIGMWASAFQQFQYINLFLENGLTDKTLYNKVDPEQDAKYKTRLKGEAYFLRAYWGFRLLQLYGGKTADGQALGYPLKMHFLTEEEASDYANMTRDSYEACAQQIMDDCDVAMGLLPLSYTGSDPVLGSTEIGRATQMAAAALKSRVALYAASPAYQPDAVVRLDGMGDYTVLDESAMNQKWARAAKIADATLSLAGFGEVYGLQATDLADAPNTTPSEFLFRTYHNTKELETRHFAPYYFGKAGTIPSQNLVDAFPMQDGYPIDQSPAYDPSDPYAGRDKRFYLNVYYHGAQYGNSGLNVDVTATGKDSPSFDPYGSRSGYYLAKFLSKNETLLDPILSANAIHYYPLLRKAEVFLNYAEAANEAWGPTGNPEGCRYTAYEVIKALRAVSGGITDTGYLDEMAQSKERFRELIHNERRIELAFENQRYFDMRRWLLPLNEPVRGVRVTVDATGACVYDTDVVLEPRKYDDIRYYYAPLPYDECVKNPYLVNNIGW